MHFRLRVPKNARGQIHLEAKLNYRKFAWFDTQFSFAGVSEPTGPQDVTKDYDDRRVAFTGDTKNVSGNVKAIPDPPIVVVASSKATLNGAARRNSRTSAQRFSAEGGLATLERLWYRHVIAGRFQGG